MDSKFRCVFDETTTSNTTNLVNNQQVVNNAATNKTLGSDSDNDGTLIASGGLDQKYLGSEDLGSLASLSNDHGDNNNYTSLTSVGSNLTSATSAGDSLSNGGDDESVHRFSSSVASTIVESAAGISSGARFTTAVTASTNTTANTSNVDVKKIIDENHQLHIKIQELERAIRSLSSLGPAYNRFSSSSSAATAVASSKRLSPETTNSQATASLLDQPLSIQLVSLIISLLIGFVLGKLDLGIF